MVDEIRVRRMTRLASYENREGKEDIAVSMFFRKDYVSVNVLKTLLYVTVGYILVTVLFLLGILETLIESVTIGMIVALILGIIAGYIAVMVIYGIFAKRFYRRKHEEARERVKKYCRDLMIVERLYEKESLE